MPNEIRKAHPSPSTTKACLSRSDFLVQCQQVSRAQAKPLIGPSPSLVKISERTASTGQPNYNVRDGWSWCCYSEIWGILSPRVMFNPTTVAISPAELDSLGFFFWRLWWLLKGRNDVDETTTTDEWMETSGSVSCQDDDRGECREYQETRRKFLFRCITPSPVSYTHLTLPTICSV